MQDLTDNERRHVLGEVLMDELKVIREYLEDIPTIKQKVTKLEEDMVEVKADIKVIKAVLTDHSNTLNQHGERLDTLEAMAHSHA